MRIIIGIVCALAVLAMPVAVSAQDDPLLRACSVPGAVDSSVCKDSLPPQTADNNAFFGPNGLITRVARLMAVIAGMASVFMIVIGGIKYATSSGDSSNINSAKNTIMFALIGLAIAATAQGIVIFVLNKLPA